MDAGLSLLIPVSGGKCQWSPRDLETIRGYIWRFDGKAVQVLFKPPTRTRSGAQNRYLWGVIYSLMSQETGHSAEEIHEFCKDKFLPRQFIVLGEEEREVLKSTTDLTTLEFEKFAEQVRAFAAQELRLNVPLPNEV